ncbi:MAG: PAS domain-containing protein [Cyanobacteria bacterium RM1_2_2]|nr:PAS domain-containing protein [Cyanobacteria bacterium RM1_2_2]
MNGDLVVDGIDIDITARKAAETALAASQQFIQKVADATPGILYVHDLIEQCNIYANREVGAVLGYTPTEIQAMGSKFLIERLHPDDQATAQSYFSQFDTLADGVKVGWEYRFRHADGSWRWLYSQDTLFARTAAGKPRLILGTVIDITERKQTEVALRSILQGTASATGEAFFSVLVQNMAQALDVRHAFVSELVGDYLQTLAFWSDGQIQPPQQFELASHPCCRTAIEQGFVCYPSQAQQQFPDNSALQKLKAESYLAVVMLDGAGNPIGNLCIVDDQPLKAVEWAEAILRIFAARAAAELERQRATIALQQLNQDLEARVEQRTQELIASLDEKEVLLKEVHHRVKNNLQMIQSLLNLQVRCVEEPKALEILAESQRRIRAMALVHEKLYQSNRLARINFAEYGRSLMRDLLQSYTLNALAIRLSLEIADLELPVDTAISCGLIINELFSNAVKYAFPEHWIETQSAVITVQFQLHQPPAQPYPYYRLTVADNGVGIPADVDVLTTKSLGLRLVHALTQQLRGTLEIERQTSESHTGYTGGRQPTGTTFTITFASQDKLNNCNDTNANSNC